MDTTKNPRDISRFLRTLRVATQTALALDDLVGGRDVQRRSTTFTALAASSVEGWRFPTDGLVSADGLLLARLSGEGEQASTLILQAQGAAGLSTYAGRRARVRLQSAGDFDGVFDRDGRLEFASKDGGANLADLAGFDIEILDDTP
jgi:hypothetical protein